MRISLVIVFLATSLLANAQGKHDAFFKDADSFLSKHVKDGKVNYKAIRSDKSALNKLIGYLNQNGVKSVKNNEEKALLINAYNLFVIKGIIDNYPTSSPLEQSDFFKKSKYFLRGGTVSLEELENEILRPITKDERLHFVLVCGALGCPKIAPYAYVPEQLEAQLDERTEAALNDDYFIRVDNTAKKAEISQIFDWYKEDFVKEGQTVLSFINKYRSDDIPKSYRRPIYTYDWTLNDLNPITGLANASSSGGSNLTKFTPSQLFGKGQFEILSFNNVYSQTFVRDKEGSQIQTGARNSIFSSRLAATFGVSQKGKVNLGVDLVFSGGSNGDPEQEVNPLQFFGSSDNVFARDFALTAFNLRLKFAPVKRWSFYSVQLGLQVPVNNDIEGLRDRSVFLALNRYVFNAQFFYDFKLTNKLRLFYEFSAQFLPRRNDEVFKQSNFFDLPSTLIFNYFPSNKVSLFALGQLISRYGNTALNREGIEDRFGLLQQIVQLGGGIKYQATDQLGFELSYGNFVGGRGFQGIEAGGGSLINFGVRFIK